MHLLRRTLRRSGRWSATAAIITSECKATSRNVRYTLREVASSQSLLAMTDKKHKVSY